MCSSCKSSSDKLDQYTLEKSLLVDIEQWRSRVRLWQKNNRERERERDKRERKRQEKEKKRAYTYIT